MYLVIDSKNPDFQLVHIDGKNGTGIAMKFDFKSNTEFKILEAKYIKANRPFPIEKPIKNIGKSLVVTNSSEYKYQIEVELNDNDGVSLSDFYADNEPIYDFKLEVDGNEYIRKNTLASEPPRQEHLIDIKIAGEHESYDFLVDNSTNDNLANEGFGAANFIVGDANIQTVSLVNEATAVLTFGTQFCKFYVV